MAYAVTTYDDAAQVRELAGAFLDSRPAAHHIIATLLGQRAASGEAGRYWMVRDDRAACVGLVLQSPLTFHATVTPMPIEAARTAVEAIVATGIALPGVNGEAATAAAFAGHWAETARVGARPSLAMRLLELGRLHQPEGVPGHDRPARAHEVDLLAQWMQDFAAFTGEPGAEAAAIRRRIELGQLIVRQMEGRPVCLVGRTAPAAGIVRIGPVYTPPEHRRRGYAGGCVGSVSAAVLAQGHGCILTTDLGNPTSNSVYRALGYRTISEMIRYDFDEPPSTNALP